MPQEEVARLEERVITLFNNFDGLKKEVKEMQNDLKELRDKLANRLPPWATLLIAALTALLGTCVGRLIGQ